MEYRDDVGNTTEENSRLVFSVIHLLVAAGKDMWAVKLLQQNPPVLNCGCWLTQID